MATLAERLKRIREQNDWTQEVLASRLDVSRRTLESWEQNRRTPSGFTLAALMKWLDEQERPT
jgi:transcriptional regulator with XRE-family HTH domain